MKFKIKADSLKGVIKLHYCSMYKLHFKLYFRDEKMEQNAELKQENEDLHTLLQDTRKEV